MSILIYDQQSEIVFFFCFSDKKKKYSLESLHVSANSLEFSGDKSVWIYSLSQSDITGFLHIGDNNYEVIPIRNLAR